MLSPLEEHTVNAAGVEEASAALAGFWAGCEMRALPLGESARPVMNVAVRSSFCAWLPVYPL